MVQNLMYLPKLEFSANYKFCRLHKYLCILYIGQIYVYEYDAKMLQIKKKIKDIFAYFSIQIYKTWCAVLFAYLQQTVIKVLRI